MKRDDIPLSQMSQPLTKLCGMWELSLASASVSPRRREVWRRRYEHSIQQLYHAMWRSYRLRRASHIPVFYWRVSLFIRSIAHVSWFWSWIGMMYSVNWEELSVIRVSDSEVSYYTVIKKSIA